MTNTCRNWVESCVGTIDDELDLDILELRVIAEYERGREGFVEFPQTRWQHRYVHFWAMLEDGSAIGWNESPRSGWSFPRIGGRTVLRNMYTRGHPLPQLFYDKESK